MPTQDEAALEDFFRKRVRLLGGYAIKVAPTERGIPDRLVLIRGDMYLVELKTETGTRSAIQVYWHDKIAALTDVDVVTLYGRQQVVSWLARLCSTHDHEIVDPDAAPDQNLECLMCQRLWTRPPKPGRIPQLCPDCRDVAEAPASKVG